MTEAEWLSCNDPRRLLNSMYGIASQRKLRLFACACCRRIWHLLADESCRQAVEFAEQYADGRASSDQMAAARAAVDAVVAARTQAPQPVDAAPSDVRRLQAIRDAAISTFWATTLGDTESGRDEMAMDAHEAGWTAVWLTSENAAPALARSGQWDAERAAQAALVRDIFDYPFRHFDYEGYPTDRTVIDPAWLTWNHGTVPAIVRRVYDERVFHDLPILADALEDAGCTDADILAHCRGGGRHVRGCWVVDLLLGKE